MYRTILVLTTSLTLLAAAPARAAAPVASSRPVTVAAPEEVVVTARRRSERAQTTPVSVSAFSATALRRQNILQLQDLNDVVPGFRFAQEGGKSTNKITLRGLDRIPLGEGVPAVVTYFSDVPLPGFASNVPTFDLNSIEVLKGPQGTLFGRNALGGAVLINPVTPSDKLAGYVDGQVGDYGYHTVEGALNVPILPGKVDLRIAGQIRREDGYVKNLNGGPDFANTRENAYRVSLLVTPTDYIRNTTVYDYFVAPEYSSGQYLYAVRPGIIPGISPLIDPQLLAYLAGQRAGGPHSAYGDATGAGLTFRRLWGISNDTRVDLTDEIQFHNIVGYRRAFNQQEVNSSAVGPLTIDLPSVGTQPFTLLDAGEQDNKEYITEEPQILGKAFHSRLSWIIGGFFNHDDAPGPAGANLVTFGIGPAKNDYITSLVTDNNYAIYGQGGLDLSGWVLNGLTLNAGYRYSWDKVDSCSGTFASYYASSACEAAAAQHIVGGPGDVGATGNQPSWTIGLDYKLTPHQFFYIVSRRGYRGVNVNTPLFTSPYTTGAVVVPPYLGGPGCTGPGNVCPDLRPFQTTHAEKLTDVEIGSKSDFKVYGVPVRFDIDGFISKYKNALQFFNVIPTGIYSFAPDEPSHTSVGINAADETITGAEASLVIRPFSNLTLTFNGAYNNAVIDRIAAPSATGLVLTASQITLPSPRFSGSISVNWVAPVHPLRGDVVVSGDYFQTAKFGAQYGQDLPGYGVGNMRVALTHIEGSGLSVDAFVKNIFDRAYYTGASVLIPTFPAASVFYGEPRTYVVEARFDF